MVYGSIWIYYHNIKLEASFFVTCFIFDWAIYLNSEGHQTNIYKGLIVEQRRSSCGTQGVWLYCIWLMYPSCPTSGASEKKNRLLWVAGWTDRLSIAYDRGMNGLRSGDHNRYTYIPSCQPFNRWCDNNTYNFLPLCLNYQLCNYDATGQLYVFIYLK